MGELQQGQLRQRQQQLMDYLLTGKEGIEQHILVQGELSSTTRLHIYRNAYQVRLRDTIDSDHPVTGTYLGDELFDLMVSAYRQQHASSHHSLRHFSDELPHFLASQTPFSDNPQIAELARFERLLLSAFDAADGAKATTAQLRSLPPEDWPALSVDFHPSVQLFESDWNAVELWQAIKEEVIPPAAKQGSEAWLLWRNAELLTEFRHLGPAELLMFNQFRDQADFATVCEALLAVEPEDQVSATAISILLSWLDSGLVGALRAEKPPL
jgi:hypothetical protein